MPAALRRHKQYTFNSRSQLLSSLGQGKIDRAVVQASVRFLTIICDLCGQQGHPAENSCRVVQSICRTTNEPVDREVTAGLQSYERSKALQHDRVLTPTTAA